MKSNIPQLNDAEKLHLYNLEQALIAVAKPDYASGMKMYMKGNFEFLGLRAPLRVQALRPFRVLPEGVDLETVVRWLYSQPFREMHYAAIDLLEAHVKKAPASRIELYEWLLKRNAWWDSIDGIATKLVGTHFLKYPELIEVFIPRWLDSDDIWLQRTCIIYQLKYKGRTDVDLLRSIMRTLQSSPEFFIQKAIGWALRQHARTDPSWVLKVVDEEDLKPLSKREALKHL